MALSKETLAEIGQLALRIRQLPDKEDRRAFAKLVRKVNPNIKFTDVDAEEAIDQRFQTIEEKMAKREQDAETKRVQDRLASEREALIGQYNEDQIKAIEKIMLDRGLSSYEDAAILYAHFNPPTRPDIGGRPQQSFELPSDKDWLTNPKKKAVSTAFDVIDEIKRKRA